MYLTRRFEAVLFLFIVAVTISPAWTAAHHETTAQASIVETIRARRVFEEPLFPTGGTPSEEEANALNEALELFVSVGDYEDLTLFKSFAAHYPKSVFLPSLFTNLGSLRQQQGYFSEAINYWEKSWELLDELHGQELTGDARALTYRTIGELVQMYARLGRKEDTANLLSQIKPGEIEGKAESRMREAKNTLWSLEHESAHTFQCGPQALHEIAKFYGKDRAPSILDLASTPEGTSLFALQKKAREVGLGLSMVRRVKAAPLPLPALVHWKVGHFAAALREEDGHIVIQDPTFGGEMRISKAALEAEASGYYLIPSRSVTRSFKRLTSAEGKQIWGKGRTTGSDPDETRDDSVSGGGSCGDGSCCSGGAGGNGASGGTDADFNGMAQYTVHLMLVSLSVFDTPLQYQPPVGPSVACKVTFNAKEASQPATFDYTNFGSKWNFSYLGYVKDNATLTNGPVTIARRNGGSEQYSWSGSANRYIQDLRSRAQLTKVSNIPIVYEKELPDSSKEVYAVSDGGSTNRRIFLSKVLDPQGNAVVLDYDFPPSGGVRLVSIKDAIDQVTTVSYELPDDIYKVTRITDPFGRVATLFLRSWYPQKTCLD